MAEEEIKTERSSAEAQPGPEAVAELQPDSAEAAAAVRPTRPWSQNPNMKWYIIHSYSGFERKVKESMESRVAPIPSWSTRSAGC